MTLKKKLGKTIKGFVCYKNVDGISTHNMLSHSRLIFTKCTSVMVSLMIKYILFFNTKATKLKLIKGIQRNIVMDITMIFTAMLNEVSTWWLTTFMTPKY